MGSCAIFESFNRFGIQMANERYYSSKKKKAKGKKT